MTYPGRCTNVWPILCRLHKSQLLKVETNPCYPSDLKKLISVPLSPKMACMFFKRTCSDSFQVFKRLLEPIWLSYFSPSLSPPPLPVTVIIWELYILALQSQCSAFSSLVCASYSKQHSEQISQFHSIPLLNSFIHPPQHNLQQIVCPLLWTAWQISQNISLKSMSLSEDTGIAPQAWQEWFLLKYWF